MAQAFIPSAGSRMDIRLDQARFDDICRKLTKGIDAVGDFHRRFNPSDQSGLAETLLPHREPLKSAIQALWEMIVPDEMAEALAVLDESASVVLDAVETILAVLSAPRSRFQEGFKQIMRTGRKLCQVQDRLYGIRGVSAGLDSLFLEAGAAAPEETALDGGKTVLTGIHHMSADETDYGRGGFSFYVPESYDPRESYPLVIALHGGSGHGRDFLWSWLKEARSRRFILLSPTSMDRTWSLMDPAKDGERLYSLLEFMGERYSFDLGRVLLTGMSDGATFALIFALQANTPFTAFAPVAGVLPPYDLRAAEGRRIYWIHGALDWMFPVYRAQDGSTALKQAGADIRFRMVDDLAHAYPRELNGSIIEWFDPDLVPV